MYITQPSLHLLFGLTFLPYEEVFFFFFLDYSYRSILTAITSLYVCFQTVSLWAFFLQFLFFLGLIFPHR